MFVDVRIPTLAESVPDATLLAWKFRAGDPVERGDVLIELETDKVVLEVPAPRSGVLAEIVMEEGETGESEQLIARIETGAGEGARAGGNADEGRPGSGAAADDGTSSGESMGADGGGERHGGGAGRAGSGERASADDGDGGDGEHDGRAAGVAASPPGAAAASLATPPTMGPAARRLVAEHGIDPAAVAATGKDGRITKADVLQHLEAKPASAEAGAERAPGTSAAPAEASPPASGGAGAGVLPAAAGTGGCGARAGAPADAGVRGERREPISRLRRRIAERLLEAQRNAAILTTFNEVDMQPVMDLRRRYRDDFERRHGVRLGFMSFFVKAAVQALRRFPPINAFIDGDDLVYHDYCDVGVAVGSPRGLVVPVLRNAERLSFAEVERAIADFGARARDGALALEELTGGTFTISNGGVFGSLLSTPILNPPQSAILGMHKTQPRPVADENGQVAVRPMMYLALSYDHRIIDGREAVQFLVAIKDAVEDPARLLLEV